MGSILTRLIELKYEPERFVGKTDLGTFTQGASELVSITRADFECMQLYRKQDPRTLFV